MKRVFTFKKASFVLLPLLVFAVWGVRFLGQDVSVSHAQTNVAEINPPMTIITSQNV